MNTNPYLDTVLRLAMFVLHALLVYALARIFNWLGDGWDATDYLTGALVLGGAYILGHRRT